MDLNPGFGTTTCIILVNPQNISCLIFDYLMEEGDPLIKNDLYKKTALSRERWGEGPSGQIVTGEIIVMSCCNTSKVIIYRYISRVVRYL